MQITYSHNHDHGLVEYTLYSAGIKNRSIWVILIEGRRDIILWDVRFGCSGDGKGGISVYRRTKLFRTTLTPTKNVTSSARALLKL